MVEKKWLTTVPIEPFWLKIKFQLHDDRLFLFGIEIAQ